MILQRQGPATPPWQFKGGRCVPPWCRGGSQRRFLKKKAKMGDGVSQCSEGHEFFFNHHYWIIIIIIVIVIIAYSFLYFLCLFTWQHVACIEIFYILSVFFLGKAIGLFLTILKAIWTFFGFVMHFHDAFMGLTFFLLHWISCSPNFSIKSE